MTTYKVLVPLDGSEFSRQILPHLYRFFTPAACEFVLFHVGELPKAQRAPETPVQVAGSTSFAPSFETPATPAAGEYHVYPSQVEENLRHKLENKLRADVRQLEEAGYTASAEITLGIDPTEAIVNFVEREDIDLITMTTHGRSGLSKFLFGSVAEGVLRRLSVPVMLLRAPEEGVVEQAV